MSIHSINLMSKLERIQVFIPCNLRVVIPNSKECVRVKCRNVVTCVEVGTVLSFHWNHIDINYFIYHSILIYTKGPQRSIAIAGLASNHRLSPLCGSNPHKSQCWGPVWIWPCAVERDVKPHLWLLTCIVTFVCVKYKNYIWTK